MNNTIFDGSHRHGQPNELVLTASVTLEELVLAMQDEAFRRRLAERAAKQTGLGASLFSSGKGTVECWINCVEGCMKVTLDANATNDSKRKKERYP